jgi:hypothetical protein
MSALSLVARTSRAVAPSKLCLGGDIGRVDARICNSECY